MINDIIKRFLVRLPETDVIIGYGSGVFHQPDLYKAGEQPMIDLIFGVKNAKKWHKENLSTNYTHYAGLAKYSSTLTNLITERIGIGVHFNTHVPFEGRKMKYGVIGIDNLERDLRLWDRFYISGRLQKPVKWIKGYELMKDAQNNNLRNALITSLLQLKTQFKKYELYRKICELSYIGDVRMQVAEDNNKIDRIVKGNFKEFEQLYMPIINDRIGEIVRFHIDQRNDNYYQRLDYESKLTLFSNLPKNICKELGFNNESIINDPLIIQKLKDDRLASDLINVISKRVSYSSKKQAISGLCSSGMKKSTMYVYEKLKKAWRI